MVPVTNSRLHPDGRMPLSNPSVKKVCAVPLVVKMLRVNTSAIWASLIYLFIRYVINAIRLSREQMDGVNCLYFHFYRSIRCLSCIVVVSSSTKSAASKKQREPILRIPWEKCAGLVVAFLSLFIL